MLCMVIRIKAFVYSGGEECRPITELLGRKCSNKKEFEQYYDRGIQRQIYDK